MIRFAWLQSRTQAAVAIGALAIVAIVLVITGPHLVHLYNANVAHCATHGTCDTAKAAFLRNDKKLLTWLGILVIVLPGIIGIFWGAPLVARELESGTHRLAWTQSVSRTRWLAVKLAVVAVLATTVAGLFSLMVTWWAGPLDRVNANRFSPPNFDARGIVVIGYAAFAFALGVTAGVFIKRTLPAMATTLFVFVTVRLSTIQWIRPNLVAPAHRVSKLGSMPMGFGSTNSGAGNLMAFPPDIRNAWTLSNRIVDHAGHPLTPGSLGTMCPRLDTDLAPPHPGAGRAIRSQVPEDAKTALRACVSKVATKFHVVTTYQPAGRYWTFQVYELALFLAAAAILCGACFWRIGRRRA